MKIINLVENTPGYPGCKYEHGLSFYVETNQHKILIDAGTTDAFIYNAEMLGIDLKKVDMVIISHGHYDHTGGLMKFAGINQDARIYMQKTAGADYYHVDDKEERYIGIDKSILALPQLCLVDGNLVIDKEVSVFSYISGRKYWPSGNYSLKVKTEKGYIQDEFMHEQCLVINENDKRTLISGCAHNGIINILERYQGLYEDMPVTVISGFHMMKGSAYTEEEIAVIRSTAEELTKWDTVFYSGHCTSIPAFDIMKEIMGDKLIAIHSGNTIM